ncbi:Spore coat protein A [Nocardia otitidiscaviarum]|uniref:Spore coat protein A n=1 Tax=Nocardia otitidiscaviarum TaxID=1823 RepID=A0A378YG57_9NOCA|nr:multicopper oxidase domain-containing protein [Nocardia otitidiscaviarum]SUA75491.1 Spore coat protein A [Nocardia otitidiscaviarum]
MTRRMTRRGFLGTAATVAGVAAAGWVGGAHLLAPGRPELFLPSELPLPPRFRSPLPIPRVLDPVRRAADADYYEITQRIAELEIIPGYRTPAWTYDGSFPGPTIVSRSGRRTVVRHRNELPRPTVVHLHGGHTPADSDGYPMDVTVPAGHERSTAHSGHTGFRSVAHGHRDYSYPNSQRAATLWYHDHGHGATGYMVWHGLAGFHLVHDEEEDALGLPGGEHDIPLMITDRSFAVDGSFRYPLADPQLHTHGVTETYMNGVLGDVILVNGAPWPVARVEATRYRFRLLNASNARRYRLELDPPPPGGAALVQIGSDGGLLARPLPRDRIDAAPAERFDIVVDFARYRPGTRVRLVNRLGSGPTGEIMCFEISGPVRDSPPLPVRLSSDPSLDPRRAVTTRDFHFQLRPDHGWTINGRPYEAGQILARPRLGTTEIWRLVSDFRHPVHIHLDPFVVLARNNRAPGPFDSGWKDTIDMNPAEAVEIAVRFTDHPGTYMLHCHNLEHEDMSMMADLVTEE